MQCLGGHSLHHTANHSGERQERKGVRDRGSTAEEAVKPRAARSSGGRSRQENPHGTIWGRKGISFPPGQPVLLEKQPPCLAWPPSGLSSFRSGSPLSPGPGGGGRFGEACRLHLGPLKPSKDKQPFAKIFHLSH